MKNATEDLTILDNMMIGGVAVCIIIVALVIKIIITYESIANYFKGKNEK